MYLLFLASRFLFIGILVCACVCHVANAATWPTRPITLIVPSAAGSGADALARMLAVEMQRALGQPVVVDNRAGANSIIGAQAATRAEADGYTLFLGSATTQSVNPAFYGKKLEYDIDKLDVVATIGAGPILWLVNASVPAKTPAQLLQWGLKNSERANCASGNTVGQVACELGVRQANQAAVIAPYRSTPQALNDAAAGFVSVVFADIPPALPLIKSGKLKVFAVAHSARVSIFPDVPTTKELGFVNFEMLAWTALFTPKGVDKTIQTKLNRAVNQFLATPAAKKFQIDTGGLQIEGDMASAQKFVEADRLRWQQFITRTGVKPE
jgi:tripartite-type tricarboxylate transporter receptor subunit TctC